jgi:hypothetical protein
LLNNLTTNSPTGKFVALYADGSGATIYHMVDGELKDAEGGIFCLEHEAVGDLMEVGYFHWMPLPDDYKLWYEGA